MSFNAPPGTKLNFLSFDHTTGRLVIEGTATVSADGLSVHTDPGTGITHPGWHGLTPPGGTGVGAGGGPKPPRAGRSETKEELRHGTETGDQCGGTMCGCDRGWDSQECASGWLCHRHGLEHHWRDHGLQYQSFRVQEDLLDERRGHRGWVRSASWVVLSEWSGRAA